MNVPLSLQIAFRYLVSKKSTNAINIITGVSMIGMGVGSMALIIVLSVFNGFEGLVVSLYNKFTPDILVVPTQGKVFSVSETQLGKLNAINGVELISQTLQEKALLKYNDREFIATVKGVDENYLAVTSVNNAVVKGNFILNEGAQDYMVMGAGVRAALAANLEDGLNPVSVFLPKRGKNTAGLLPTEAFTRKFIFPSGMFSIQQDFDYEYVYVPLSFMREALKYQDEITSLEIKVKQGSDVRETKAAVAAFMGSGFKIKDRIEQDEFLFKVMQTERWAVYAILTFILIIASFNIIGSLSMIVLEKSKDISILKTMGATRQWLMKVFLLEGILSATIGSFSGILLGLLLCFIQIKFGLIKLAGSGTFVINAYPVDIQLPDILLVISTVMIIGFLASIVPAWNATKRMVLLNQK
jgi:lipoprotein-releasing system permease protein